jgi:hypothetical protein
VAAASVRTRPFDVSVARAAAAMEAALPVSGASCFFSDGFAVPIRMTKQGKKPGRGTVDVQVELGTGDRDRDTLKVICEPAA